MSKMNKRQEDIDRLRQLPQEESRASPDMTNMPMAGAFSSFGGWAGKTTDGPTWTVATTPSSVPGKCCLFVAYPGGISVKNRDRQESSL